MPTYRFERAIQSPPDRVYEVFTDWRRTPEIVSAIRAIEPVSPEAPAALEPGFRFRCTREMNGKAMTEELVVEAAEPGRGFTLGCDSCGSRFDSSYTFEPAGDGTRVGLTMVCRPVTLSARLMSPMMLLFSGMVKKSIEQELDELQAVCETG